MSRTSYELRCPECSKLLATSDGIKCPRCKKIHTYEESFSKDLKIDQYILVSLWKPDGSQSSSVIIRKEIWINIGSSRPIEVPKNCLEYPVFFIYNYLDPSQSFADNVGCRVNKEPILDFQKALTLAKQQVSKARSSGQWVDVEDVKDPELKRPIDGVLSFRNLEQLHQQGEPITFQDLSITLNSYSDGWAILAEVVIKIVKVVKITLKQDYLQLKQTAEQGASKTRGKDKQEWLRVVNFLKTESDVLYPL